MDEQMTGGQMVVKEARVYRENTMLRVMVREDRGRK